MLITPPVRFATSSTTSASTSANSSESRRPRYVKLDLSDLGDLLIERSASEPSTSAHAPQLPFRRASRKNHKESPHNSPGRTMDSVPPPPPMRRSFPSLAAVEDEEPLPTPTGPADSLAEVSEDALAQAVSKRLRDFTELKTKVQALELAMAVVAEENRALKQKLADKDRECVELQREVGEVQMKMAEIITNITHLNDASVAERRSASAAGQRKPQF
ncbi:uncharacterized protein ACA1_372730 [Acanthamoeba castellanii str. Neff]|uniref:Uncharacterized protein n=1 Tax=Acanthamoeba castellanii (strain ATCC 30010 / Neff) TaxID=1257118 RepID=L8GH16_ACACF|nr:uncharacterized protein ACA1_372730 [Acanthamoeba castellanii str. Neff]ELR12282.1 hypothetical protein ACA1_372730 [Acanthamoeba castellanii str. Neff]